MSARAVPGHSSHPIPIRLSASGGNHLIITVTDQIVSLGPETGEAGSMSAEYIVPACVFLVLSFISVILRLYARVFLVRGLEGDDYIIIAAFVSSSASLAAAWPGVVLSYLQLTSDLRGGGIDCAFYTPRSM